MKTVHVWNLFQYFLKLEIGLDKSCREDLNTPFMFSSCFYGAFVY
jgi:hypothetical protein